MVSARGRDKVCLVEAISELGLASNDRVSAAPTTSNGSPANNRPESSHLNSNFQGNGPAAPLWEVECVTCASKAEAAIPRRCEKFANDRSSLGVDNNSPVVDSSDCDTGGLGGAVDNADMTSWLGPGCTRFSITRSGSTPSGE